MSVGGTCYELSSLQSAFDLEGYLILDNLLSEEIISEVVSSLEDGGTGARNMVQTILNPQIVELISNQKLNDILKTVFKGSGYTLHHLTSAYHDYATPSLRWHHDRVPCYSDTCDNKQIKPLMVHCLIYPNGITSGMGSLLLIPGSHRWSVDRYDLSSIPFQSFHHIKINNLKRGAIVLVNSLLVHGRQAASEKVLHTPPRFFIDVSYCQSSARWEPYIESNYSWISLFKLIQRVVKDSPRSDLFKGLLSTEPYKSQINRLPLPDRLINCYYRFKSIWFRNIASRRLKSGKTLY